tara:strand:- start:64 stop:813 length:750 start_codon:yes stop_codon:yes gene_type:complete
MIDEKAREEFARDGFVHLPGFMDADEMDAIEALWERALREVVPTLSRSDAMYEDYDRPDTLKQVALPEVGTEALATMAKGRFDGPMEYLMEEDVVGQGLEMFIKPRLVGTPTPPHQDGFYFCLEGNRAATAWLALDDMDDENGTLHYVAGSQQAGVLDHRASQVLGFSQGLLESELALYGRDVACPLRRGDLLVHHCLTIHRAAGNRSQRLRRALALVYYAASERKDTDRWQRYRQSADSQRRQLGVLR